MQWMREFHRFSKFHGFQKYISFYSIHASCCQLCRISYNLPNTNFPFFTIASNWCLLCLPFDYSTTVISGAGMYRQIWESTSLLWPTVVAIAPRLVYCCCCCCCCWTYAIDELSPHSMFVLKRPAVKKMAVHSCCAFSFVFNERMNTLEMWREQFIFHSAGGMTVFRN